MYRQVVRRCLGILLLGPALLIGGASTAQAQHTFLAQQADLSYTPDTETSPLVILPEVTGAPTITYRFYSINSALPAGLSFDSAGWGGASSRWPTAYRAFAFQPTFRFATLSPPFRHPFPPDL